MALTATTESSCAGDAAPDGCAGACGARDAADMLSDGDAPGATRARGGSARPSQAGGAADPAAGSDACGGGAAGRAASDPGAAPPGDSATPLGVGPASQMTSAKAAAPIARPPATMPSVSSALRDRLRSSVHVPVPGVAGALLASGSRNASRIELPRALPRPAPPTAGG